MLARNVTALTGAALLLVLVGCNRETPVHGPSEQGAAPAVSHEDNEDSNDNEHSAATEHNAGAQDAADLPVIDKLWDFRDPAGTEAKFRELLPQAQAAGDLAYELEVLTQIARTQGLQQQFDDAHATLDDVDARLPSPTESGVGDEGREAQAFTRVRVRSLLERGRTLNSSGKPEDSIPVFEQALEIAVDAKLEYYAVDAAHMLGIAATGDDSIAWNERALDLARNATEKRARTWLGAIANNLGWTYFDLGRYEDAVGMFEISREAYVEMGHAFYVSIARWAIAKMYRFLDRVDDALAIQMELLEHPERQDNPAEGYTREEIGECLLLLDRGDEAVPHFARAWELLKDDIWLQRDEPERLERMKRLGGLE